MVTSKALTKQMEERINLAVQKAESKTSAEIVPVVAHSSTGFDHVFPILFLAFGVLGLIATQFIEFDKLYPLLPWHFDILLVVGSALFSYFLAKLNFVRMILTTDREEIRSVALHAQLAFYESSVHKTKEKTGILLFLSLAEHRAVVLADKTIADKVPKETWDEVIQLLITEVHKSDLITGFEKAIHLCGEICAKNFPTSSKNENEIPNKLTFR